MMDIRIAACALGGEVAGRQVTFPPPGHSRRDRSACLRFDPQAPGGFLVHSFAGEDPLPIRDYVRERLGIARTVGDVPTSPTTAHAAHIKMGVVETRPSGGAGGNAERTERALALWRQAMALPGTLAAKYLGTRLVEADDAWDLRFHPDCPWRREDGSLGRAPALIALLRDVATNEPCGIHRTALSGSGQKLGRRMLGRAGAACIKLDPDENVQSGLVVGEGIETVLTARALGFRPAWAMGSVGAIASFPVLPGIEALTILEEVDESGASARAVEQCGNRWHDAGREVLVVRPKAGSDLNDAIRGIAA